MPDAVLFDFDGTVADTLEMVVQIGKRLMERDGYDLPEELEDASVSELRQYTKSELLGMLPFSKVKLPQYMQEVRTAMLDRADEITLFDGMQEEIESLSEDYTLGLLSSNSAAVAERVLKGAGLLDRFTEVQGGIPLFGKSGQIRALLDTIDAEAPVYLGDTVGDIDACKHDDIPIISVTWGYQSCDALQAKHPDRIVDAPEDIRTAIQELD